LYLAATNCSTVNNVALYTVFILFEFCFIESEVLQNTVQSDHFGSKYSHSYNLLHSKVTCTH